MSRQSRPLSTYYREVPRSEYYKIRKMRDDRYKLREIGEKYGISRERVRQILLITQ